MKYLLALLLCGTLFFDNCPSASGRSAGSYESVASLESLPETASGMTRNSGLTNPEDRHKNELWRYWWNRIREADQNAYRAQNPEERNQYAQKAQALRNLFDLWSRKQTAKENADRAQSPEERSKYEKEAELLRKQFQFEFDTLEPIIEPVD